MPVVELATEGLRLPDSESGDAAHLGFGTPQDDAVRAVAAALGAPEASGHNDDCDAGPLHIVEFQGGLRLYFQAGEFAGWNTDGGWSTNGGIAAGMSYSSLAAAARDLQEYETSFGTEFHADGLSGQLSEAG